MRAKDHEVLVHAVDLGVSYGISRFFKHREDALDHATLNQLADAISGAVIDEMTNWFTMDGDES